MSSGLAAPAVHRPPDAGGKGQPRDKKTFRRDIQGLRALGLFVMFLCHAEWSWGSGGFVGLDIFFVISGFLITGLIVQEMERTGRLSLSGFYARRIRRLLPLAMTVLAVVVVASSLVYSPLRAETVAGDVVAASLYFVNWRFQAQEVDYFAVDPADSPIQHFWSLSVEEQFYLVWPLLLLCAFVFIARRGVRRLRRALWVAVALVGVPSLLFNTMLIDLESNGAYFSTPARMWEFALGGALALALPAVLHLPRTAVAALSWTGMALILATTVAFSFDTPYPGTAALIPTLATAAIVIAGSASATSLPLKVLSSRPFQYVGDISYAWYLWHWPALVFARAAWGPLSPGECLLIIAAAWVPTAISNRLIEERFRYSGVLARRPRRALAFGAACVGGAVVMASALTALQPKIETASSHQVQGALAAERSAALQTAAEALRPTPRQAKDDRGQMFRDGCLVPQDGADSPECVYGERTSHRRVVLFGDSHAMHYFPALERIAERRDWRLVGLTRAACTAADVRYDARCDRWRERALRRIERAEQPDLILIGTSTTSPRGVLVGEERLARDESEPIFEEGLRRTLRRLRATGARVVVLADTPRSPRDVAECVSQASERLRECAFADNRRPGGQFDVRAARTVNGVRVVDPARLICPQGTCAAVIGNALVFRDTNHLTATFARTLSSWLGRQLPRPG